MSFSILSFSPVQSFQPHPVVENKPRSAKDLNLAPDTFLRRYQPRFGATGWRAQRYDDFVQKTRGYPLDSLQRKAVDVLAEGNSALVSAPTSAGKTLIAQYLIEEVINPTFSLPRRPLPRNQNRVFFTAPRKAILNEKLRDFQKEYGAENVGIMTGDITHNPDAPIMVMTTEVLQNMLYEDSKQLENVKKVIFDEFHFINDDTRGPVWEECVIHMPKNIQAVYLSATFGTERDTQKIVDWLNSIDPQAAIRTKLVFSDQRPIPLKRLILDPNTGKIEEPFDKTGMPTDAYDKAFRHPPDRFYPEALLQAARDFERQTGNSLFPLIVTSFNRRFCDDYFTQMAISGKSLLPIGEAGNQTREKLDTLIATHLRIDPLLEELNPALIQGLKKGYGVHHSGMTYTERSLVEQATQQGLLKCVFATDTLGAGINVPAKTAAISAWSKFNGTRIATIEPTDIHQIWGRAGRRGMYDVGYAVIIPPLSRDIRYGFDSEALFQLIHETPKPIESKFAITPFSVLRLLQRMPNVDKVNTFIGKTLATHQHPQKGKFKMALGKTINSLERMGLIVMTVNDQGQSVATLTPLGQDLSSIPEEAFLPAYALMKLEQAGAEKPDAPQLSMLPPAHMAALCSGLMNRRGRAELDLARTFNRDFVQILKAIDRHLETLVQTETETIQSLPELNFTYAPMVSKWVQKNLKALEKAQGSSTISTENAWRSIRKDIDKSDDVSLYIGDFMSVSRQTAHLLEVLIQMKTLSPELKANLVKARNALLQPPVQERLEAITLDR